MIYTDISKSFCYDYHILNKALIEKYKLVVLPDKKIQKYSQIREGKLELFKKEDIFKLIEEIANCNLEKERQKRGGK